MSQYLDVKVKCPFIPYMIIANQVNVNDLHFDDAESIIQEFLNVDISKALDIIDLFHVDKDRINSTNIPMGGEDIDVLRNVPKHLNYSGITDKQLGLLLTNDPTKSPTAHRKFGAHYGTLSCLLGLAKKGKIDSHNGFFETPLGSAFKKIENRETQIMIIRYLFLSIPIIQYLLYVSKQGKVDAYSIMSDDLSNVTKERRGHSLRAIFRILKTIDSDDLSSRIANIVYVIEE